MSRKELWDKVTEEIDDKYIEEAAQTIIKKAGTPIDMNKADLRRADKSNSRSLPVILSAAAAIAMIIGAGYILDKYDIGMSSTHDGEQSTTVSENNPADVQPSVSDEQGTTVSENNPADVQPSVSVEEQETIISTVQLNDNTKVTLLCDYENSEMTLQLRQYNVTILDKLKTDIVPSTNGNVKPELRTLHMTDGTLIYLSVPKPDEDGYKITLYAAIDGKLRQFCDQNGPLVIESDTDTLDNIASSDIIFTDKVLGETRKYYVLNFQFEIPEALEFYYYPDIDTNTEPVNFADLDFIPYDANAEYLCKGYWNVTFGGAYLAEEGSTFSFSKAINASETDKAWFFTDIEGGPRGVSGTELYVIFKDNPDVMYLYHELSYADKTAFCNYDMVFERTHVEEQLYTSHTLGDFKLTATYGLNHTVKFTTTDPEGLVYLNYDTGITVNEISYNDEYGSAQSSEAGTFVMDFGDRNVIGLYVADSYTEEHNVVFRTYYFDVENNKITPFCQNNRIFYVLTQHPGNVAVYEHAKAFSLADYSMNTGDIHEYYFLNFGDYSVSKGQLFPADTDTSLVNYENLVFDKKFENEYENPFINKWTLAYMDFEEADFRITSNLPVAETDKAWYCVYESSGITRLLFIYKENTGLMYSFRITDAEAPLYHGTAHCDHESVYKIADAPAVVPNAEAIVYNENNDYSVAVVKDNTLKLHVCDLVSGVSNYELNTGITCSDDKKPTLTRYYVYNAYDLIVLSVDDTNTLFVSSKYRIDPLTYAESGEAVVIRKPALEFGQDNNLNEFYVMGPYSEEKIYYKVNPNTSLCTTRQIFPADSNTSPINLSDVIKGEAKIPESDPFFGKWDRAYGHWMPDKVYFENEGVECYETDTMWCRTATYNEEEVVYIIMKDNPDYMYRYPYSLDEDYRLCNYDRVFERADITEKTNVEYVRFDSFSVKLSYTTGLKTTLRKLEAVRGAETFASLDINFELSTGYSDDSYWGMNEHELKDGNIVSLLVREDGNEEEKLYFYHCSSSGITPVKFYDIAGNETDTASIYANGSEDDNVLMITDNGMSSRRFMVDFANNTAKQFYAYALEGDESEIPDFTAAVYDTGIIEEIFYGQWLLDYEADDRANPGGGYRYHYDPLIFSYMGRCIDYPSTSLINSVYEDEKGWYAIGKNGGGNQICFVAKDNPDILYCYIYGGKHMNEFDMVYKRSDKEAVVDTITAPSQLTAMGVRKLAETTGFNIFDPPESVSYDKAKKWVLGDVYREGIGEVYLTSLSENKITYCRRAWPEGKESVLYPEDYAGIIPNHDVFVYLTFTAEKTDGEWKITSVSDKYARELYELVYELQESNIDLYNGVIELILSNYRSDEFWDEGINPEKQRITAAAIRNFKNSFNAETDSGILSDGQLVYSMCLNTYWRQ